MIEVYHKNDPTFRDVHEEVVDLSEFTKVAIVRCGALRDAFRLTNHIDEPWFDNEEVEVIKRNARSSSVGDLFHEVEPDNWFICQSIGWHLINVQ